MRAVDTNILVRVFERDDPVLTALAESVMSSGEIFVPTIVLCEFAWVLRSTYRRSREHLAEVVERLLAAEGLLLDRDAANAGLAFLAKGGDFSDGVVLYEADRAKCRELATFDRRFARLGAPDVVLLS